VPEVVRQIFAFSGLLSPPPGGKTSFALVEHALSLARRGGRVQMCYVPTAVGDSSEAIGFYTGKLSGRPGIEFSVLRLFTQPNVGDVREHLLGQDLILVEGGSVVNLMAIWQAHGVDAVMRECWHSGVVMAGASAGSLCWHTGGPTDSYRDALDPFTGGLALVPYSNGVHDDLPGQPRRQAYRRMIAQHLLPAGYATEDGVGLHYTGTQLHEAVAITEGKHAWHIQPAPDGGYTQRPIEPRPI
jgi:peptidase E